MPRYEVVKMKKGHVASHWNGDKKVGGRSKLFLGAIVDMPEDVAAKYGDVLKRIDGNTREATGDVPAAENISQHTPPVATRTVSEPAPTLDQAAPLRVSESGANVVVTEEDLEDLLSDPATEVVSTVKSIDDVDQLKTLKASEKKGKNRVTVLDAIDARVAELK